MSQDIGIKCPQCGSIGSRVIDTKHRANSIDRYRVCDNCSHRFTTIEVATGAPVPTGAEKSYRPVTQQEIAPLVEVLPQPVIENLLIWWNEARWSKWRGKAVWTARAFRQSAIALRELHAKAPELAAELAAEATTTGWQALKAEYLGPAKTARLKAVATNTPPGPRDPALQRAAERWRNAS